MFNIPAVLWLCPFPAIHCSLPGTIHITIVNYNFYSENESEVAQSCLTLCDPMDCSLPGSSVHGIFQARVLEWVAISFSSGSSWPRDGTQVSHIVDRCFTIWATREVNSLNVLVNRKKLRRGPAHKCKTNIVLKKSNVIAILLPIKKPRHKC